MEGGGFRVWPLWLVIMRDALVEGDKVPVRRRSCYENRIESFALVAQVKIERERRTLTLIFEGKLPISERLCIIGSRGIRTNAYLIVFAAQDRNWERGWPR